jgi:hypothetical protein
MVTIMDLYRRYNSQWQEAESKFKNECISQRYPYPEPKINDTPIMDRYRRQRARRKMLKAKKSNFGGITTKATAYMPRHRTPQSPPADALATSCPDTAAPRHITPLPMAEKPKATRPVPRREVMMTATDTCNMSEEERAKQLMEKINEDLDGRSILLATSGEYIDMMKRQGSCVIYLQPNKKPSLVDGDVRQRPLLIVNRLNDLNEEDYQFRYIHINEKRDDYYAIGAFVGDIEQSDDIHELSNKIAGIYYCHKDNIIGPKNQHHDSYEIYCGDGMKASTDEIGRLLSSLGIYATKNIKERSYRRFRQAQNAINSCIHQANKYLNRMLCNDDAIMMAANSSCVKLLVELYKLSPMGEAPKGLETLHSGEDDLYWCSSNVCVGAGTKDYHTEEDNSLTMILRPYFQSCCHRNCQQHQTTFNFKIPVNGSEELKIPLVDGCVILFSGKLLEHRQQNSIYENTNQNKNNCGTKFINVSCYSNGRFRNHLKKTTERVFETVKNK